MLTQKQYQLLHYVNGHLKQNGIAPSFEEMKEHLGLRSKSGVHRLIKALEERGFIRRLHHRARALEVIKLPNESSVTRDQQNFPDEALQDPSRFVSIPISMISKHDCYALEIAGDSMTDAGILDGDIAIIERVTTAENGEIVVALIDDNEATLKRLRKKGASVALEPANPEYETRIFGPDQVKVQGRLIGLIRNY